MPSFAVSICVLSLVQGLLVAVPRPGAFAMLERLRGPAWAIIPAGSVAAVVYGLQAAAGAALGLTYLALVAVPLLAAVALGRVMHGGRPALALAVVPLFALAWADRAGLAGQAGALVLTALACVTLGSLLEALAPARWLKVGIVAMAAVDSALVISHQLQAPNNVLNAAAPAINLPQLQEVVFGHAVMGFGDLFIAGVLGALLARGRVQRQGAVLAVALALAFNLLFLVIDELPATVPIALTLIVLELVRRRRAAAASDARTRPRLSRRTPRRSRTAPDPPALARRAPP